MQSKARTNQGGSVISFLIVGVVLAAIALGAIYFAQQRGKDAATEPINPPIAVSPSASPSTSPSVQAPSSSPKPSASPSASPVPSSVPSTGVMPATGPSDSLLIVSLPVALLTAASVAYSRSRRLLR